MALRFLFDTNAAVYLLSGRLETELPDGRYGLSVITEIELLSFPRLSTAEEAAIFSLLETVERLPLTEKVRDSAIAIRRKHNLKLPDAVIAATALEWKATLLSNDKVYSKILDLSVQTLALKAIQ